LNTYVMSLVFALTTSDKINTKQPDATSMQAICSAGFCMTRITTTGTSSSAIIVHIDSRRVAIRSPRLLKTNIFGFLETVGAGAYNNVLLVDAKDLG
jgi:hypothetical protein